jgi:hypothetical protein
MYRAIPVRFKADSSNIDYLIRFKQFSIVKQILMELSEVTEEEWLTVDYEAPPYELEAINRIGYYPQRVKYFNMIAVCILIFQKCKTELGPFAAPLLVELEQQKAPRKVLTKTLSDKEAESYDQTASSYGVICIALSELNFTFKSNRAANVSQEATNVSQEATNVSQEASNVSQEASEEDEDYF